MDITKKMIQQFVHTSESDSVDHSHGNDGVTLVDAGLELVTQKKVICKFENFSFGLTDSFQVEVEDSDVCDGSTWNFNLEWEEEHAIFKYDASIGYVSSRKEAWHCVEASILETNEMKKWRTYKSNLLESSVDSSVEIFRISDKTLDLPLINGSLVVEVNLKIVQEKSTVTKKLDASKDTVGSGSGSAHDKPRTDFRSFLNSKTFSDVKIISSCGKEFPAHKIILSAESEVFNAMLKSEMTESATGIIKLDDMSAASVTFLLHFLYCRDILPFSITGKKVDGVNNSSEVELTSSKDVPITVEEALYAGSKYRLEEVLSYIEGCFRRLSNEENAVTLFELSKLHSLKCKDFLKEFIMCQPRIISKILEP